MFIINSVNRSETLTALFHSTLVSKLMLDHIVFIRVFSYLNNLTKRPIDFVYCFKYYKDYIIQQALKW